MHIGNFYIQNTDGIKMTYHIPTGTLCKISDEIFNSLINNNYDNPNLIRLVSSLEDLPLIKQNAICGKSELLGNLLFISSENCNLRCKYCFVEHGRYNNKLKTKNMELEIYMDSVNYVLSKYPKGIKNICFFGGEPLLNFDVIKEFVLQYENQILNDRKDIYRTNFSIITNGALVDKNVINFFEEHKFAVTLSLDGPKHINDAARLMANGKSSYDAVYDNLDLWSKSKFNLSLETTICDYHIKNYEAGIVADWINNFRRLNFNIMAMYVVVTENFDTKISDIGVLKNIFNEAVDYWFNNIIEDENLNCADTFIVSMINNILQKKYVSSCSVHNSLAVTPWGEIYPCQLFCKAGSYGMGSIYDNDDLERDKVINKLIHVDRKNVAECQKCWLKNFCSIWCKGNSENFAGNLNSTVDIQCLQAKTIAERIMFNLALIITDNQKMARFTKNFNALKQKIKLKEEYAYEG